MSNNISKIKNIYDKTLQFEKLGLADIDTIRPFFLLNPSRFCDRTVGTTMMWRDFADTCYYIDDGILYLKAEYVGGDLTSFVPPILLPGIHNFPGEAFVSAVYRILDYCCKENIPVHFAPVAEPELSQFYALFPNMIAAPERNWSDYLYDAAELRDFSGRKYQRQRNHINKLYDVYPDWFFTVLDQNQIPLARRFLEEFAEEHPREEYPLYTEGNVKSIEVLDNWEKYAQVGGILYLVSGSAKIPAGVSLGEVVGDTLFVHTEKAAREINGAYPALVREVARAFTGGDVTYINREEDDGVDGLRRSKESYHPIRLIEKYQITLPQ